MVGLKVSIRRMVGQPEMWPILTPWRLSLNDGQRGSYRFVRRISAHKRAGVYEYRVTSRVVGNAEVIPGPTALEEVANS